MSHNLLHQVQGRGVSVWLDGVSRTQLRSGELAELVRDFGVAGVTTNPTLFAASLADADAYAADLADMQTRRLGSEEAARLLAAADVRTACDTLLPVHEATHRVDGWVSLEVNPAFAYDVEATLAEVRSLSWLVDRPNLMIKIPATPAGIAAIRVATGEGYSINATLIFSAESYRAVLIAYIEGLRVARSAGLNISDIYSVASLFVSRVDVAIASAAAATSNGPRSHQHQHGVHAASHEHQHRDHPRHHGSTEHNSDSQPASLSPARAHPFSLAGVANARQIFGFYQDTFATAAWQDLAAVGANPQRPLWASTGVKDPALDPTTYVSSLAIPGTVNTMPLATLGAASQTPEQLLPDGETSTEVALLRQALERLNAAGDTLMSGLLADGVSKFQDSWNSVLRAVSEPVPVSRTDATPGSNAERPTEVWLA